MNKKYLISALCCAMLSQLSAEELSATSQEQTDLHVTIYNDNLALIKDKRELTLPVGVETLAFKDVSAQIMPETAILSAKGVTLLEQNFEYDLLSPESLLKKFIGRDVVLERYIDKKLVQEKAKVLADNNGTVLKVGDKIRTNHGLDNLVFDQVPKDLRERPTLTMVIDNKTSEKQSVSLSYLSGGLGWHADYVISLDDENKLDLKGWVTLDNNSGTTYKNAKLQLVAGKVNRAPIQYELHSLMKGKARAAMAAPMADLVMAEEALFEYHLYTLPRQTTIKNNQKKQVSLLQVGDIPYKKQLVFNAQEPYSWERWRADEEYQKLTAEAKIIINNKKADNLGMPMPAGIVRTYQKDSQGNTQFIGEDRIGHTPENETIKLKLGESFDVTAKRKQTDYDYKREVKQTAVKKTEERIATLSYEVIFKNAKDKEVTVDYQENFFGNWEVKEQSLPSEKLNSTLNRWKVAIPAKGETKLVFIVEMKHEVNI